MREGFVYVIIISVYWARGVCWQARRFWVDVWTDGALGWDEMGWDGVMGSFFVRECISEFLHCR